MHLCHARFFSELGVQMLVAGLVWKENRAQSRRAVLSGDVK